MRLCLSLSLCVCAGVFPAAAQAGSHPQLASWRHEMEQTLSVPEPLPALNVENFGTFYPEPGVVAQKVTYGTEYGMRIPAVLYLPEHHVGRMPAMVVVNGHGGDKYSWYSFYTGILYARAGAAVLTYDPIGEGERNDDHRSGTREHDKVVDVEGYPQHLSGLMITDVMQDVSYLRQRPDIDSSRIAILGYSMGSFVSALTGAVDTRIHAVVLSGGGDLDGPGGYWDRSSKLMCQAIPWQSLKVLGDRPAVIYALNQQRGKTFIINGTADTLVDIPHHLEPYFADLRKRVEAITGTKREIFETYFIPNVSHRPNWVTRPGALWLKENLGLPNWTKQQIEQMPETHISEWANENNVTMDKGYTQEDREGGVMALGTGLPNLTREQLTVVPMPQWEKNKDDYVYSAWVRHTLALLNASAASSKAKLKSAEANNQEMKDRRVLGIPFHRQTAELEKMASRRRLGALAVVCLSAACMSSSLLLGQDTRHVEEPTIPPACATVPAGLDYHGDRLEQTGARPDTWRIQKAMDHCRAGHAVVLQAANGHNALLTGPLTLKPGVTLVVDQGIHLVASNDPEDYDRFPGSCGLTNHSGGGCKPLISAIRADHSGIMGLGVIEGRGDQKLKNLPLSWWEMHNQRSGNVAHNIPWLVGTEDTNDFTLYGITLRNAPNFNVFLAGGNGITAWGVKIDEPWDSPNTDGIDPSGCTNVTVTRSFIRNGDDVIAIKAPKDKPSQHISVTHNHFYEGHGLSIGSGTEGGVSHVQFVDNTLDHMKAGIHVKSNPGRGGLVHKVVFDDICIRNTTTPIDFETTYIDANAPREGWINGTAFPTYRNIVLHNVQTQGGSKLRLTGIDVAHRTELEFDGVYIGGLNQMKPTVAHARITLGPGGSNWIPTGNDVTTLGNPGKRELPSSCIGRFVPFPEIDEH